MAVQTTPSNFNVQQGQSKVLLNWDIMPNATQYLVQRSTDGVNFAALVTVSVNTYTDSAVTLGTKYWYQVASTDGIGTSAYCTPDSAVPALPGKYSLFELRLRSKQRADRVNSNFVTLSEWNFFINEAAKELYDILIDVYEDYYVASRLTFLTDGISQQYALPNGTNYSGAPALYKLYGVDLGLDNSNNAWVTIKKFNFISRNRYVFPQVTSTFLGVFNLRYRLVGDNIMFIPTPSAGQTVGLWYFPRLNTLLFDTDILDGVSGWEQYVIVRAAKYALDKEESDTSKLDAEILYLKERIESAASNRDAGQPDTISDTRSNNERWGGFGGWGFDGSSGGQ